MASEKGTSNWLSALPVSRYNLNKSEFSDGIYLRYGWEPTKTTLTCACGANFNLTHALHCAKGGYTHIRHNEIRDIFANLMNELCHDVEIEPTSTFRAFSSASAALSVTPVAHRHSSAQESARYQKHNSGNILIKQVLASAGLPSTLYPLG